MEILEMNLEDFENIKDSLQEEFDDFWTASMLKQELENIGEKPFRAEQIFK